MGKVIHNFRHTGLVNGVGISSLSRLFFIPLLLSVSRVIFHVPPSSIVTIRFAKQICRATCEGIAANLMAMMLNPIRPSHGCLKAQNLYLVQRLAKLDMFCYATASRARQKILAT